ncbi:C-terminal binding protein [Phaeovulum sp.]|uniref:C-terminal binding protein n=1 Tax=Phaeovulum sp. TaxID=2934796 RepID=UPI0039E5C839
MSGSNLKLVVTDQAFGNTRHEQAAAKAAGAVFFEHQCKAEDETLAAVQGAQAVLNNFAPMTRKVMAALAPGAVVVRYGVGVDNVDLVAAKDLGVRVCNVPDYGVEEVADHATAFSLALARKLGSFDSGIRSGEWKIASMVSGLRSLRDTTVGLIGMGRIARAYAARMAVFGCKITGFDPYVSDEDAKAAGITPLARDEVIASANILSLHLPFTPQTRHLINAAAIATMPAGAIVINCSRGGLIDEDALAAALVSGQLSGAGLDVFEKEPLPDASPLRKAPNVLMSPHAAFYSDASVRALQRLASEEALRGLRGEALRCALT